MCEALRTAGLQSWKKEHYLFLFKNTLMAIVRELKRILACCLCFLSFCAALSISFHSSNFLLCLLRLFSWLCHTLCLVFFLLCLSIPYSVPFSAHLSSPHSRPFKDQAHKTEKLPFLFLKTSVHDKLPVDPTADPQIFFRCQITDNTFVEERGLSVSECINFP